MVRRGVWLAAVPWNTHGGMFDFLCVGCLEARLGRQLTADDFPGDVPMNFDSRDWRSERLQARLRAVAQVADVARGLVRFVPAPPVVDRLLAAVVTTILVGLVAGWWG